MKRTTKKLSVLTTIIRALRVLTTEEAGRVYGASLNGVCGTFTCEKASMSCCPTRSTH
jgi:hypothetical protein